ncbi:hypothetical protein ATO6_08235 [Oceanicola sp. 22II-s10i]|uniref:hypothetical protein n=1 Tax=Oceanicola sp. 22II-s10i TaxID=1317116 RepID=UPI000B5289FE|nr:hypothetical protein [Oceanicola sp. 22II-s10i]OWU85039.1 hypothetical protein ATO6_08235 [Oceanicola sp. 22II-s10i]
MPEELDIWTYFEKREEEIVQQRARLQEELSALRLARTALETGQRQKLQAPESEGRLTIKDMIRSVLLKQNRGGTSDQIINWINDAHGTEVARTSLSPQLSRLKADGEVALNEETGLWSLTEKCRSVMTLSAAPSRAATSAFKIRDEWKRR